MADNTGHGLLATGNKKSRRKTSPCILTGTQYGKQPRGLRRGSAAARFLGMRVRISPEAWIVVSSESCVLSGTSATGRSLVQRSTTECGVSECDRETSTMSRPWPTGDSRVTKKIWKTSGTLLQLISIVSIRDQNKKLTT